MDMKIAPEWNAQVGVKERKLWAASTFKAFILFYWCRGSKGEHSLTTTRTRQEQLRSLGWDNVQVDGAWGPISKQAFTDFQRGFAFWSLLVDGAPGPKSDAALSHAVRNGGRASPNFRFAEFRCKGKTSDAGCRRIWVNRALVSGLEQYRRLVGGPVSITSGCRCSTHNQRVGGSKSSQHLYGFACDVPTRLAATPVRRLRLFSGFGTKGGRVLHMDMRHLSGNNPTRGTPDNPTVWVY